MIQPARIAQGSSNEGSDQVGSHGNYDGVWYEGGPNSTMGGPGQKPKKRIRRTANEINRRFVCICGKAYGSEGSLNQHKKNKGHYSDERGFKADPAMGMHRDGEAFN